MGASISGDHLVCHDSLDDCRSHCDRSECVYVDKCNGGVGQKYVCLIIDPRFITWVMIISFLIVLCVCSSLVAFYVCRAFRWSFRNAERTDGDIVFQNVRRVHHFQIPRPKKHPSSSYFQRH